MDLKHVYVIRGGARDGNEYYDWTVAAHLDEGQAREHARLAFEHYDTRRQKFLESVQKMRRVLQFSADHPGAVLPQMLPGIQDQTARAGHVYRNPFDPSPFVLPARLCRYEVWKVPLVAGVDAFLERRPETEELVVSHEGEDSVQKSEIPLWNMAADLVVNEPPTATGCR